MPNEMMPIGRDFYLSRKPHGATRATVTHHRVTDPKNFYNHQCDQNLADVKTGRKEFPDSLVVVTEEYYRDANGLKHIVRSDD